MIRCYLDRIMDLCNCLPFYALVDSKFSDIKYAKYQECTMADIFDNATDNNSCFNKISNIKPPLTLKSCGCYTPCYDKVYEVRTTYSNFPSQTINDNFAEIYGELDVFKFLWNSAVRDQSLKNDTAYITDLLRRNFILLDIYFEDLKYTEITETPNDSLALLISDVGGQFGLWVGVSIITVFELIHCLCYALPKNFLLSQRSLKQ